MASAQRPRTSLHAGQENVPSGSAKEAKWPIGKQAGAASFSDKTV
jgi:hypothetical protein